MKKLKGGLAQKLTRAEAREQKDAALELKMRALEAEIEEHHRREGEQDYNAELLKLKMEDCRIKTEELKLAKSKSKEDAEATLEAQDKEEANLQQYLAKVTAKLEKSVKLGEDM